MTVKINRICRWICLKLSSNNIHILYASLITQDHQTEFFLLE